MEPTARRARAPRLLISGVLGHHRVFSWARTADSSAAFQRRGADPAFGSGPLAPVVQDLLSIIVYFAVATPIAT